MPERLLLDADTFQNLLAAAYVLQEDADRARPRPPAKDHTQTLSEIVEIQSLIHGRQLDLTAATALISERVQRIANAAGVAVGMVEGEEVAYRAGTGSAAGEAGFRIPIDESLSAHCLRTGQVLQSADAEKDPRLSVRLCRERGLKSLIALPVYHEGKVAGVLEIWFARVDSFQEHDVRTCQLLAGLIAEAIARNAEIAWKQALAAERAAMLEALEKLKPQLERLTLQSTPADQPANAEPARPPAESQTAPDAAAPPQEPSVSTPPSPVTETRPVGAICRGCGHQLGEEESFCGLCGTARDAARPAGGRLQSKWASMWRMQQAAEEAHGATQGAEDSELPPDLTMAAPTEEAAEDLPDVDFSALDFSKVDSTAPAVVEAVAVEPPVVENGVSAPSQVAEPSPAPVSPWSSALRARAWLESLKAQQPSRAWLTKQWQARRADIYLVVAAILLLVVLSGFGTRSTSNTIPASAVSAASARRQKLPPPPQLTLFEKLLVGLGLAEPPPPSVYLGNPKTQVWVDVHTALYYCPGADLYGKTPGGKFTSQHDAQQDQFEPARHKACD
ncbi:MAG TPA: GAF domain-containing protein [Terriglobales bacterium]|jgi:putative methionine-R-sulfoxide reductase with GAF domain|nr:GAF domain-containing protein [Terriglobales bacterium]